MSKQTFLQGAVLLIIAGLITRLLGFVNRIVTARLLGEEGVGLYMMALPTLVLVFTITQVGLPIAIAKRVSELETAGHTSKIRPTLHFSLALTVGMSVLTAAILWFTSPFLADTLLQDERVAPILRAIIPALPVVAISSVLKGYFQGRQNMKPQAYTQVLEQLVRIGFIFLITPPLLTYGIVIAATGVMAGAVIGEFISLLFIVHYFRKDTTKEKSSAVTKNIVAPLLAIAMPASGSRAIGSTTYFLEPVAVAQGLALYGYTATEVSELYGQLTGFILPLIMMPAFFTHGLSTALVPALSEAHANGETPLLHHRLSQATRLSLVSGGLATIILLLYPALLLSLLYDTTSGSGILMIMAPFFLFHYIQSPLQAALQALDLAKAAMLNSLFGNAIKYSVLLLLTTSIGFTGVVVSMIIGVLTVTGLHIITMYKHGFRPFKYTDIASLLLLFPLTFLTGLLLQRCFPETYAYAAFSVIILVLLYITLSFLLGLIKKEEWHLFTKR